MQNERNLEEKQQKILKNYQKQSKNSSQQSQRTNQSGTRQREREIKESGNLTEQILSKRILLEPNARTFNIGNQTPVYFKIRKNFNKMESNTPKDFRLNQKVNQASKQDDFKFNQGEHELTTKQLQRATSQQTFRSKSSQKKLNLVSQVKGTEDIENNQIRSKTNLQSTVPNTCLNLQDKLKQNQIQHNDNKIQPLTDRNFKNKIQFDNDPSQRTQPDNEEGRSLYKLIKEKQNGQNIGTIKLSKTDLKCSNKQIQSKFLQKQMKKHFNGIEVSDLDLFFRADEKVILKNWGLTERSCQFQRQPKKINWDYRSQLCSRLAHLNEDNSSFYNSFVRHHQLYKQRIDPSNFNQIKNQMFISLLKPVHIKQHTTQLNKETKNQANQDQFCLTQEYQISTEETESQSQTIQNKITNSKFQESQNDFISTASDTQQPPKEINQENGNPLYRKELQT